MHAASCTRWAVQNCAGPTPGTWSTAKGVCSSLRSRIDPEAAGNDCRTQSAHSGDRRYVLLRADNRRGVGTIVDTDAIRYRVYWRDGARPRDMTSEWPTGSGSAVMTSTTRKNSQ